MAEERERSTVAEPVKVAWDLFRRIGHGYARAVHINACIAAGVHPGTASKQYADWMRKHREAESLLRKPEPGEEAPPHSEDR